MDSINPSNGAVIARAMLADDEDARRAIAAAKRAFESFGRKRRRKSARTFGADCTRSSRCASKI